MNVRWMAVLTGFLVDVLISFLLSPFISPELYTSPDLTRPGDMILLAVPVVLTAVSGYVAGRMAKTSRVLNGFLVQVVAILFSVLLGPLTNTQVVTYALASLFAALGGYLSQFPGERQQRSSDRG
jgi:putative membrane protein (TIGR04086 family)